VATRHRSHLLEPLIDAVLSDAGALEFIIVVDGLDDSSSASLLENLGDRDGRLVYFWTEQGGQMNALQRGVAAARGDLVLLLDDDVLPISPLATGHSRRHHGHGNLVVVGSMPVAFADGARAEIVSRIYSSAYEGHCQELLDLGEPVLNSLWMGNVSLRRDLCLDVGVNSPSFASTYHTDRDFGYRLGDAGLVGVFDPSLRAVHLHSRTPEAFLRDARRQGAGLKTLHTLYPERLGPFNPKLLIGNFPFPIYMILKVLSMNRLTSLSTSRILFRTGLLAGALHFDAMEATLVKTAQHLMQCHGARVGEDG
jgi:glycosyltransferase involved in cell wall biosynthesis